MHQSPTHAQQRTGRYIQIFSLLIIAALMHSPLTGSAQTITLNSKKITLPQVFAEIKKQVNYAVVFNPQQLDTSVTISVKAKDQPLEEFMKAILAGRPLTHSLVGTTIVVFSKAEQPKFSQPPAVIRIGREVSGWVYDENTRTPIAAVSVIVSATGKGIQTNEKGLFTLKDLREDDVITFSIIGYEKQRIVVKDMGPNVYVAMKIATSDLDQAVVQGYGITSKRMATGNIGRVTAAEIEKQPVTNPLLALQGKVPGLEITQVSGLSGAPVKVEIRGRNSINPNFFSEPLYVIDGIPLTVLSVNGLTGSSGGLSTGFVQGGQVGRGQSPLFSMDPNNIQSIEVLKDGDATAIYGSRAANGVILITTKKAKPGKTSLNMKVVQGITNVPHYMQMLNTQEYLAIRREAFRNDGITPTINNAPDLLLWDTTRYTNWQKELMGTGKDTYVSAGLSGGDTYTSFGFNGSYGKRTELQNRTGSSQKGNAVLSITHRSVDQKLMLTAGANYSFSKVDALADESALYNLAPNAPAIFDEKGELNYAPWNAAGLGIAYPFAYVKKVNDSRVHYFSGNMNVSYTLVRGLVLSANTGFSNAQSVNEFLYPIASQNPIYPVRGMAVFGNTRNTNFSIDPELKYTHNVAGGNLTVQAGATMQTVATSGMTTVGIGYDNDNLLRSPSNAQVQQTIEGRCQYKYAGVFGRLNYNVGSKYIFNVNVRRDGSSRFAEGRQYGNFGSVAAAWTISEEEWAKKLLPAWFNYLKFRTSFAVTGSDKIGDYQQISQWTTLTPSGLNLLPAYTGVRVYVPVHAVNQSYHWEQNKQWEIATNMSFWDNRISLEVAYYRKRAGDQLTFYPTAAFTGFTSVVANQPAKVQNTGLEMALNTKWYESKDWSVSGTFNISIQRNKLIAYPGIEYSPYYTTYKVGQSLSTVYLLHYLGVDPQTGNYAFEDHSKDGKITIGNGVPAATYNDDRYIALDLNPRFTGGGSVDVRYKAVSLSLYLSYKKQMGLHPFYAQAAGTMRNLPLTAGVLRDHWRKPGDIATFPRYTTNNPGSLHMSDGAYTDASYLRFNTLALSYTLPQTWVKKIAMSDCRFSMNIQNLFAITSYPGIDPEAQNDSGVPVPRVINTSLTFNF